MQQIESTARVSEQNSDRSHVAALLSSLQDPRACTSPDPLAETETYLLF
jgi:hypothetical protein